VYATANQPGETTKQFDVKLTSQDSTVMVDVDVTPDTFDIHTGVKLDGRAGVELTTLSLACNGNERVAVDFARAAWAHLGTDALYTYRTRDCASGVCLVVERQPLDTRFVRDRDVLDAEIADHLWIHVPLAVWADDTQTLPVSDSARVTSRYGATDLPSRLAVVASAWGTLSLFYPYFADQHLDWQRELRPALVRAATAGSLVEISRALFVLLASLHDNHARAYHPSIQSDGVLPLALRRFGDTLVVVGTLADYAKRIPIGTEIVSIDGIQAEHAYADMLEHTPSATAGWSGAIVPFWLTVGRLGALAVVRMRTPDGSTRALLLPHLSRELYDDVLREPMPATGTELQAGVYYVDLNELKLARWQAVLPSLSHARVMILDMRGYPTNAAFTILGHFSGREIPSLQWLVPALGTRDFKKSSWTIRPVAPKLDAKLIVLLDGRAVSAAETVLQLVHDNHLGVLVGEASAGSNGNVIVSELPAGFSMRFTGLRVLLADGTALQGRGIMPDHVVHPTLAGVRAGRDEILEAALQLASRL
jgi:hypothetical protein